VRHSVTIVHSSALLLRNGGAVFGPYLLWTDGALYLAIDKSCQSEPGEQLPSRFYFRVSSSTFANLPLVGYPIVATRRRRGSAGIIVA